MRNKATAGKKDFWLRVEEYEKIKVE